MADALGAGDPSQWLLFPRIFYKEENDLKIFRNRTVIGVLCILLALIICFGVTPLFSRSASEKTEIVRVTKDIKEGDEITAEMVQTVEVGAYNLRYHQELCGRPFG